MDMPLTLILGAGFSRHQTVLASYPQIKKSLMEILVCRCISSIFFLTGYVEALMAEVFLCRNNFPTYSEASAASTGKEPPQFISATFQTRSDKATLVEKHHTRFSC